jgi:predicted dehydrogenase
MLDAAIVGLGAWGQRLVRSAKDSAKLRVVAGTTRTRAKAQAFAAGHGIRLVDGYEAVLADPAIDAVLLATPHSIHGAQVIAAAKAGKHVYVEKPFTLDGPSAREAAEACAKAGTTLAVAFTRRFRPAIVEMRRLIASGELGQVLHVEGSSHGPPRQQRGGDSWRARRDENPGGAMTAKGVHVLDVMLWMGGQARAVTAFSDRREFPVDVDDVTTMLLRFDTGATGYLSTIYSTATYWRLHVAGSKGWAELRDERFLTTCPIGGKPVATEFPDGDIVRAALEGFADAVAGRARYPVPPDDAVNSSAILEAIERSVATGTEAAIRS